MFLLISFAIFSAALFAAGYWVWAVPRREEARRLAGRLRELRLHAGARAARAPDLLRRERRGRSEERRGG